MAAVQGPGAIHAELHQPLRKPDQKRTHIGEQPPLPCPVLDHQPGVEERLPGRRPQCIPPHRGPGREPGRPARDLEADLRRGGRGQRGDALSQRRAAVRSHRGQAEAGEGLGPVRQPVTTAGVRDQGAEAHGAAGDPLQVARDPVLHRGADGLGVGVAERTQEDEAGGCVPVEPGLAGILVDWLPPSPALPHDGGGRLRFRGRGGVGVDEAAQEDLGEVGLAGFGAVQGLLRQASDREGEGARGERDPQVEGGG